MAATATQGGAGGTVPEVRHEVSNLRREHIVSHIRTISKASATPKTANALQDLLCEVIIIFASLLSAKTVNIPILNSLGGEEGKCQPMPIIEV